MIDTLIVPGLDGSGPGHWQRLWAESEPDADIVEQEHWDRPVLSDWLSALEARLAAVPGAVLVAHSLGCALIAHLAHRPAASHVAGALLVAPADIGPLSDRDRALADFALPRDPLPFRSIVVASRDDPYMSFARAREHADDWGAGFVDLGQAGHINVESGFGRWSDGPILADGLRRKRPRASLFASPPPRLPDAALMHDAGLGVF